MEQMTLGNSQSDAGWESPKSDSWPPVPSRAAGLESLAAFIAKAGDFIKPIAILTEAAAVMLGSVALPRHRMICETEVLGQMLKQHTPNDAFKFIQEVFWRAYWKGWLEHRSCLAITSAPIAQLP